MLLYIFIFLFRAIMSEMVMGIMPHFGFEDRTYYKCNADGFACNQTKLRLVLQKYYAFFACLVSKLTL